MIGLYGEYNEGITLTNLARLSANLGFLSSLMSYGLRQGASAAA